MPRAGADFTDIPSANKLLVGKLRDRAGSAAMYISCCCGVILLLGRYLATAIWQCGHRIVPSMRAAQQSVAEDAAGATSAGRRNRQAATSTAGGAQADATGRQQPARQGAHRLSPSAYADGRDASRAMARCLMASLERPESPELWPAGARSPMMLGLPLSAVAHASTACSSSYPTTGRVWQTLNIGKPPRVPNNAIISGAVHGQMSRHCSGVVCPREHSLHVRVTTGSQWTPDGSRPGLQLACDPLLLHQVHEATARPGNTGEGRAHLGLLCAAVRQQPVRRLAHERVEREQQCQWQRGHHDEAAPAEAARQDGPRHAGEEEGANRPEDLDEREPLAAVRGGEELEEKCVRDMRARDAKADEGAEDEHALHGAGGAVSAVEQDVCYSKDAASQPAWPALKSSSKMCASTAMTSTSVLCACNRVRCAVVGVASMELAAQQLPSA